LLVVLSLWTGPAAKQVLFFSSKHLRIFVSDINFSPAVAVTHIDAPPLSAELFWGKQAISSLNLGISATFAEKDLGISAIFAKKNIYDR
jgi:hypothetical protein